MINFIYFDVGGVLLRDFSGNDGYEDLKKAIGVDIQNEKAFDIFFDEITPEICTTLDVNDLLPKLKKEFGASTNEDFSLLKAFVDRFEKLDFMQDTCDKITSRYNSGLLTNMYPRMLDEIKQQGKLPNTEWKTIIDSSTVGFAKPDEKIFHLAEKECGRKPKEILFIDNTRGHLEVAKSLDWQTFWFDPKNPEESANILLKKLGLE